MSHYSRIKTKFHNREALITTLKQLGYEVGTDTVIKGHHGEHTVDIAVKTKGYGIGFVRGTDGNYDMVADWWGVAGADERRMTQELVQAAGTIQKAYTHAMVLAQAKADGFEVVSQTEEQDGSLRIVVRRWK